MQEMNIVELFISDLTTQLFQKVVFSILHVNDDKNNKDILNYLEVSMNL